MIERFLDVTLIVYLTTFIVLFTAPFIIGISVGGIEGLEDMLDMLKDKYYYSDVVKPILIFVTYGIITAFLIVLLLNII